VAHGDVALLTRTYKPSLLHVTIQGLYKGNTIRQMEQSVQSAKRFPYLLNAKVPCTRLFRKQTNIAKIPDVIQNVLFAQVLCSWDGIFF
jgi:hypothetical protein